MKLSGRVREVSGSHALTLVTPRISPHLQSKRKDSVWLLIESPIGTDDRAQKLKTLRQLLQQTPGIAFRVMEAHALGSHRRLISPLRIRLTGPDVSRLAEWSESTLKYLLSSEAVTDVMSEEFGLAPELRIKVQAERVRELGLVPQDISQMVSLAVYGRRLSNFLLEPGPLPVVIEPFLDLRASLGDDGLNQIRITTPAGESVPLTAVCDIQKVIQPACLRRWNRTRMLQISASPAGETSVTLAQNACTNAVRKAQDQLKLSPDYRFAILLAD